MKIKMEIAPPEAIVYCLVRGVSSEELELLANFVEEIQEAIKAKDFREFKVKNLVNYERNIEEIKKKIKKIRELFYENIEKVERVLREFFLFEKFPEEITIYLGYSFRMDLGIVQNNKEIIMLLQEGSDEEDALDIFIHELLHILLKTNGIKIPEEENFIRVFAPNGIISKKLGLSDIRKEDVGIWEFLYEYNFERDIWNFIKEKAPSPYEEITGEFKD